MLGKAYDVIWHREQSLDFRHVSFAGDHVTNTPSLSSSLGGLAL